jgi:hypothetical protein
MKLSSVLASVATNPEAEKTASASPAPTDTDKTVASPSTTAEKLSQALKEATADPAPAEDTAAAEKRASANSPVEDLFKTAGQIASAEHEALVKEAHLYGAAVADGFLARVGQHTEAAEKVAAANPTAAPASTSATDDSFEKFAADNPDLVKEAAELGYATTMGQLEKLAEDAYATGYNGAVESIYKLANASFVRGFEDTAQIITSLK